MQRPHISEVIHNPGGYSLATVWLDVWKWCEQTQSWSTNKEGCVGVGASGRRVLVTHIALGSRAACEYMVEGMRPLRN